ncbi:MAG TPA: GNAT family N-acetyltransferase [Roseiflexaceae bacterium]|nr:GNAT family N-acetyltransferase [Roseiflexaceae bacterium]
MVPTLTGDYLELRPLPEHDLPALLKVYQGTPLFFDGLGDRAARLDLAEVRAQWQADQTPGRALLGVYHIETDLLIGAAELRLGVPAPDAAALWLLIWGGFQRQGYGQECMALLERWLVEQPGVAALYAVAGSNEEGRSFLALQGFAPTGEPTDPPVGRGAAEWVRRSLG